MAAYSMRCSISKLDISLFYYGNIQYKIYNYFNWVHTRNHQNRNQEWLPRQSLLIGGRTTPVCLIEGLPILYGSASFDDRLLCYLLLPATDT